MQAAELPVENYHPFNSFLRKNEQLAHLSYHLVNAHFNFISVLCILFFGLVLVTRVLESTCRVILKLSAWGPAVSDRVGLVEEDRIVRPWPLPVPMVAFRSSPTEFYAAPSNQLEQALQTRPFHPLRPVRFQQGWSHVWSWQPSVTWLVPTLVPASLWLSH